MSYSDNLYAINTTTEFNVINTIQQHISTLQCHYQPVNFFGH